MKQEFTTQEVLDFLEKNNLKTKDLMEITGYGKSQVYEWQDKKASEPKMPWEIWLLLNALFNRKAPFVTGIIWKYGTAETSTDMELPELRQNTRKEIEEKMEALKTLKYLEQEFELIMKEESINHIHTEHLARIKDLYYSRRGIHGIRIREYEVYKKIREAENYLGIETAVVLQDIENLSKEYNPDLINQILDIHDGYIEQLDDKHCLESVRELNKLIKEKSTKYKKTNDFLKRLLKIYDEYIEQLEEARSENYFRALVAALDAKKTEMPKGEKKNETKKQRNYLLNTLEQKVEIERFESSSPFADRDMDRKGIITPLHIRKQEKKNSEKRENEA